MMTPLRLTLISVMAATLGLAGCSYTPARIQSGPLVEIEDGYYGYYGGHRHDRDDRHYRDRDYQDRDHRHRHDRDYHDRDRRRYGDDRYEAYRHHRDDHPRGGFCPPGLEMQGRC